MKRIPFLGLILLLTIISCKKDPLGNKSDNSNGTNVFLNTAMTSDMNVLDYPTNENGILKFRDFDHFNNFYFQLELIEANGEESDEVGDDGEVLTFDDKLNAIEHHLSFTSIRKEFYINFEEQNEIGWTSMDQVPDLNIPLGDILLTLMNEDKNIIVGDTLYNYLNDSVVVKVFDYGPGDISKIRNANGNLIELSHQDLMNFVFVQNIKGCTITNGAGSYKTLADTTWTMAYHSIKKSNSTSSSKCAEPNYSYTLRSSAATFYINSSSILGWDNFSGIDYYVDWGDGTIESGSSNGAVQSISRSHTYNGAGNYTVIAKYKPAGYGYYPVTKTYQLNVPNNSCASVPQGAYCIRDSKESSDGSRCVQGEVKCYKNWLFPNAKRVRAKTWGFKKKNGKWKKRKMNTIKCKFDVDVLIAYDCSFLYPLSGSKSRSNRKRISEKGRMGLGNAPTTTPTGVNFTYNDIGFEKIISVHEIDDGGSSKSAALTLTLNACDY